MQSRIRISHGAVRSIQPSDDDIGIDAVNLFVRRQGEITVDLGIETNCERSASQHKEAQRATEEIVYSEHNEDKPGASDECR